MTTKVIILNGPPNSGKDAIANKIMQLREGAVHKRFKDVLYVHTAELFKVDLDWLKYASDDRVTKNAPNEKLVLGEEQFKKLSEYYERLGYIYKGDLDAEEFLISPREALIYTSELVYKPKYGKDYFGKCAAESLSEGVLNVFSDGGFKEEIIPLIDKVGYTNITLVHLYRKHTSFAGDSREYIHDVVGIIPVEVHNNSTIEEAAIEVLRLAEENVKEV